VKETNTFRAWTKVGRISAGVTYLSLEPNAARTKPVHWPTNERAEYPQPGHNAAR
jgi:hypothetical protein